MLVVGASGLAVAAGVTTVTLLMPGGRADLHSATEQILGADRTFPTVDVTGLSPVRQRIIATLRTEFAANRPGRAFSGGVSEPWCADFVSAVLHEAGVPLRNPNSGSWRIPGVATLTDYFRSAGRLRPSSYSPRPGDVVLYEPPNALGQHTDFVVAVNGDTVTTVGGNQHDGISALSFSRTETAGLAGYGVQVG
jgi:hypothetical protein